MSTNLYASPLNNLPLIDGEVLPVHLVPQNELQIALNDLDKTSAHRVENDEPAPGPFGSAAMLYNIQTADSFIVGDRYDSNRVNRDGPHAHAEAVSLYPEAFIQTTQALQKLKDDCNWVLVFLSTGQSCPSCFTKQHVAVNAWKQAGFISTGRVLNFYGADYDMTKSVAGFSDKDQLNDMIDHPNGAPLNEGKVNFIGSTMLDIDIQAQEVFRNSNGPVAVVMQGVNIIGVGYDTRVETADLLATAEMNAVKAAYTWQAESESRGERKIKKPWDLSGAKLISATPLNESPLARTAMFWSSIGIGTILRDTYMDVAHNARLITQEAHDMQNHELYEAGTYQNQGRADTLIHALQANQSGLNGFKNLAQHAWNPRVDRDAARGESIHYDGGKSPGPACC